MATTTFSTLSADAVTYIREEILDLAEKLVVFAQFAEQVSLPQHNSKTIQFSRYPYLALPTATITEGTTPTTSATLSVATVTATMDQWGLTVILSDLAQLTVKHPLIPIVNDLLGYAMSQLVDREVYKVLLSGATVVYPSTVASRATIGSANVLDDATIMKVAATLRSNGARAHDGSSYILVVDPYQEQDIINQTSTFLAAHQFKNVEALYNGEVGRWRGYRVVRSNLVPVLALIADSAWSDAASGSDGTWGGSKTVFVKVTGVDTTFGFESQISNAVSQAVTATQHIVVTVPSTTGYTYNVYVSDTDNTSTDANLRQVETGIAAGGTSAAILTFPAASGTTAPASPPSGVNVHVAFALGRQSFAMVKLSGDNMRVLVTGGKPEDSDPLAQRKKLSFKGSFKSVVLNSDFLRRIETASSFN